MLIPILKQVKEPHTRIKFICINIMYQNNYCIEIRADNDNELHDKVRSNIASQITSQFNCFMQDNNDYIDLYEFIEEKDNISFLWNVLKNIIEIREDAKEGYLKRIAEIITENKGRIFKAVTLPGNIPNATELQLKERKTIRLSYYVSLINVCIDYSSNGLKRYINIH